MNSFVTNYSMKGTFDKKSTKIYAQLTKNTFSKKLGKLMEKLLNICYTIVCI